MRWKTAAQLARSGAKRGRIAKRTAEEAQPHEPGRPPRPLGLTVSERRAWNRLRDELLVARKLWRDDGPKMLALVKAQGVFYRGGGGQSAKLHMTALRAELFDREPFPEPEATTTTENSGPSLEDFLADVRQGRETFLDRLVPDQTLCLDLVDGKPVAYGWPADDGATAGRQYCLDVIQGGIPSCQLLKRAAHRHLEDLETGASHGWFYDPLAARQIVTWFESFCGLKLQPWEVWLVTSLLAWKRPTGMRRFTECWLSVGRKNGKSALLAGLGLWGLVCDGEKRAQVYSAATKKDQAKIIFNDARWYVDANPGLRARLKKFINSLNDEESGGVFQPLSSDTRSMDGLRPSWVLADEVHEWDSREQWSKLASGIGSRTQPILIAATTAGAAQVGFAWGKFEVARKVLEGIFPEADTFVGIWELDEGDDFKDENNWIKANPNLGVSVSVESLRKLVADVEQDAAAQNDFFRYQMNRWVSFKVGRSIPIDRWDACRGADGDPMKLVEKFFEENGRTPCWGGIDLGLKEDLSAFVLLFKDFGTPITAIAAFWMPEVGLAEKERRWGVPLSSWVRAGWIELCDGEIVDPQIVQHGIAELCRGLNIHAIGYDDWNARVMAAKLHEATGITIFEVPQKPSTLTQPAKLFKNAIWQKQIRHFGNPVLRWMVGNTVLEEDPRHEGIMPKKFSDNEKIDGVQALLSAWAVGIENPGYLKSGGNPTLA